MSEQIGETGGIRGQRLTWGTAGIANAILIFVTFVVTIPGIITPARSWLKLGGIMATFSALFSMIIGLYLWILTLKTREDFAPLWAAQPDDVQRLMQTEVRPIGSQIANIS